MQFTTGRWPSPLANNSSLITRMIFRALPERLSEAEIDEMLRAADTDGKNPWAEYMITPITPWHLDWKESWHIVKKSEKNNWKTYYTPLSFPLNSYKDWNLNIQILCSFSISHKNSNLRKWPVWVWRVQDDARGFEQRTSLLGYKSQMKFCKIF